MVSKPTMVGIGNVVSGYVSGSGTPFGGVRAWPNGGRRSRVTASKLFRMVLVLGGGIKNAPSVGRCLGSVGVVSS